MFKPFKPPRLVARANNSKVTEGPISEPPQKKRRISADNGGDDVVATAAAANILKKPKPLKTFQAPVRRPLESVANSQSRVQTPSSTDAPNESEGYYAVLWRKFTTKKNKTWDDDGVLSVKGGYARLQDISGRELGKAACKLPLEPGSALSVGGKDVQVESVISRDDFLAGRPFLGNMKPAPSLQQVNGTNRETVKAEAAYAKAAAKQKDARVTAGASHASRASFKAPVLQKSGQPIPTIRNQTRSTPRHDPSAEGALVMARPTSAPKGKEIVDVVVDPILTRHLREHQRVGVAFMYECVMGLKGYAGEGAILADEMGLGKTLQTIALLWTLLKQNPIHGDPPVVKKALIVCPVTLINNWRREFSKWLGRDRIGVFVAENKKVRLTDFTMGKSYSVMIIGYEKLRMVQEDLKGGACIDIVIADEGHRMKTATNKSALAIKSLATERRVILSGTPLQNDLAEFHTMVDFVNPGLLSKYTTFKKEFETPILKSQQPGATKADLEKGEARSEELANITGMFILRRTADILSKYLPSKTEYVVLCKPTEAQRTVYRSIVGSPTFNAALGSSGISLELITILKKVCNSPNLLLKKESKSESSTIEDVLQAIPPHILKFPGASGKLQVLDSLLHRIRTTTDEKVILVSNYTSTLDVLAGLLSSLEYKFLRLDGTTPQKQRQELVDRFNRSPPSNSFVFLLSAKAGGVGLNLIGASRMILFDLDWNPATDLQAMARIHRDGQKRPCYIYRLITQGAIDEKIWQRQVTKTGLADAIVDGKAGVSGFTREELRDLFTLDDSEECQTHKLLSCACGGTGLPLAEPEDEDVSSPRNDLAALCGNNKNTDDEILRDQDGVEIVRLDSEEPLLSRKAGWKNAKGYDWRAEEAEIQRKAKDCFDSNGKAKMKSLMQYAHFDTSLVDTLTKDEASAEYDDESEAGMPQADPLEGIIEDSVLRSVVREGGRRVGFVFSKLSG